MNKNQPLTGRMLCDLTGTEIEELINLSGADKAQIVTRDDSDWPEYAKGNESFHHNYGVKMSVESLRRGLQEEYEYEQLAFWEWQESVGEERNWDTHEYSIRVGQICGPWGDSINPVLVVQWFLAHGWHFADESQGAAIVARERARQIAEEGYGSAHDDAHKDCSLAFAAICYAQVGIAQTRGGKGVPIGFLPMGWPWHPEDWKTKPTALQSLIVAAALMTAEIDRILRTQSKPDNSAMRNVLASYPNAECATDGEFYQISAFNHEDQEKVILGADVTAEKAWQVAAEEVATK